GGFGGIESRLGLRSRCLGLVDILLAAHVLLERFLGSFERNLCQLELSLDNCHLAPGLFELELVWPRIDLEEQVAGLDFRTFLDWVSILALADGYQKSRRTGLDAHGISCIDTPRVFDVVAHLPLHGLCHRNNR